MSEFDWSVYTRAPVLDVPGAVALTRALLSVVPKEAPAQVKAAARNLHKATSELQRVWSKVPPARAKDARPLDTRYDNAWSALRSRIGAVASLSDGDHPDGPRADKLLAILFPTGADFLKLPYPKQWAECDKRITQIEEQNLVGDVDDIAGKPFWSHIQKMHEAYGEALGITKGPAEQASPTLLVDPLRAAQRSIAAYLLQIAAAATHDPDFEGAARRAVAPIDDARAASARRAAAAKSSPGTAPSQEDVGPQTPLPDAPSD